MIRPRTNNSIKRGVCILQLAPCTGALFRLSCPFRPSHCCVFSCPVVAGYTPVKPPLRAAISWMQGAEGQSERELLVGSFQNSTRRPFGRGVLGRGPKGTSRTFATFSLPFASSAAWTGVVSVRGSATRHVAGRGGVGCHCACPGPYPCGSHSGILSTGRRRSAG